MNKLQLKLIIKECVRECLEEILEEKRHTLIKETEDDKILLSLTENKSNVDLNNRSNKNIDFNNNRSELRERLKQKLGLDNNSPMYDLFEDTSSSNNEIIKSNPQQGQINESLEKVSESAMEKIGIFNKDWSKFL